ncbi:MAG: type II secretion system protein [Verrucomicrobiaceae bacterium]|nr:type II secretion system protein [Verrucomicrobiaceae bacterium]
MKPPLFVRFCHWKRARATQRGFSFIEMLVVVALIALLATIAITSFSPFWTESTAAADRRNAQDLAALSASAEAFGAEVIVPGDLMASISNLVNGVTLPATQGRPTMSFKVPINDQRDVNGAAQYLKLQGDVLEYHSEPQSAP